MNLSDLLKTNTAAFKEPPKFPAGLYEMVITGYDLLPFSWRKSGKFGLAYVPTVRAIRSIEADDQSNPELAAEQQAKLDEFGDWTKREFQFAYSDQSTNPPRRVATISEINFPLIETDASGSPIGFMENMAWRFYLRKDGQQSGFVVDKLGLDYPEGAELETIMEDTVGKTFLAQFEYELRLNDPTRSDLVIKETMAAA
jgi:hypothetical protein